MKGALCLLCAAVCLARTYGGPLWKPDKTAGEAASQEDVSVLMFGVIQFSQTLSYIYESTEAKMAEISQTLQGHAGALQRLGNWTAQAAEVERQLKGVLHQLQVQMAGLKVQTISTKNRLASVEQEEEKLQSKVGALEAYLNSSFPNSIKELQEKAKEHYNIIRNLHSLIQHQKQSLEGQSQQLYKLQKMSEAKAKLFFSIT